MTKPDLVKEEVSSALWAAFNDIIRWCVVLEPHEWQAYERLLAKKYPESSFLRMADADGKETKRFYYLEYGETFMWSDKKEMHTYYGQELEYFIERTIKTWKKHLEMATEYYASTNPLVRWLSIRDQPILVKDFATLSNDAVSANLWLAPIFDLDDIKIFGGSRYV